MISLFKHEFQSRLTATIGWGIGLILFGSLYITIFPQVAEAFQSIPELPIYQAMGFKIGTFADFIASIVLVFLPLLIGIYTINTATHTIAGEDDDGTLELIVSSPLKRWQILVVKALAIALSAFLILFIAGIGNGAALNFVTANNDVDVNVSFSQLLFALLNVWPLSVAFAMIGLFLSSLLPSKRIAAAVTAIIFVASYLGENVSEMVESLEGVKTYSLFSYQDTSATVFIEGVQASDVLILLAVAVVFLVLAILAFDRRNVSVGAWPWQR